MRTLFLVGLFGFSFLTSNAQVSDYIFSYQSGLFTTLPDYQPLDIDTHEVYDDIVYPEKRQLPFSFVFNGIVCDSLGISENGYLWFGKASSTNRQIGGVGAISAPYFYGVEGIVSAYGRDLHPHLDSTLPTYIFSGSFGTAPYRTFVVEWRNTGRYETLGLASGEDTISFQILLYETLNKVEIKYGYVGLHPYLFSVAELGVRGDYGDFNNRQTINGKGWNLTEKGDNQVSACEFSSWSYPRLGDVFTFEPGARFNLSVSAGQAANSLRIVNPVQNNLQLLGMEEVLSAEVQVYDMGGRTLLASVMQNGNLDVSSLAPGTYILSLSDSRRMPFIKY